MECSITSCCTSARAAHAAGRVQWKKQRWVQEFIIEWIWKVSLCVPLWVCDSVHYCIAYRATVAMYRYRSDTDKKKDTKNWVWHFMHSLCRRLSLVTVQKLESLWDHLLSKFTGIINSWQAQTATGRTWMELRWSKHNHIKCMCGCQNIDLFKHVTSTNISIRPGKVDSLFLISARALLQTTASTFIIVFKCEARPFY